MVITHQIEDVPFTQGHVMRFVDQAVRTEMSKEEVQRALDLRVRTFIKEATLDEAAHRALAIYVEASTRLGRYQTVRVVVKASA